MALDLAQLAHLTRSRMIELASLPYEEAVKHLPTWREWYHAVEARLDVAADGEVV
jgi:hypothetical protein